MRFTEEFDDGRIIEHTIDTTSIAAVVAVFSEDDSSCVIKIYFVGGYASTVFPPSAKDGRDMIDIIKNERKEFISVCWKTSKEKCSITTGPYGVVSVESEIRENTNTGLLRVVFDYSSAVELVTENVFPEKLTELGIDSDTAVFMTLKQHIEQNLMRQFL